MADSRHILLIGRNGQVGHALGSALASLGDMTATDRSTLDLTDVAAVRHAIQATQPDIIINAAAYTAVDRAESEPQLARLVNATVVAAMAEEAARAGSLFVHYSTDYVFDGTKGAPYEESDPTAPLGVYGRTKLEGEEAILRVGGEYLILRTSWVYGQHGQNFFRTMRRLAAEGRTPLRIVADQQGTPTWAGSIAEATRALVTSWEPGYDVRSGVYHLSNEGETTWYGFAREIFSRDRLTVESIEIEPISTAEYPTPAVRPAYSVLSKSKVREMFGVALPEWEDALQQCLSAF